MKENENINYTMVENIDQLNIFLKNGQEFPGNPVVRTLNFHYERQNFDPWSGN